MCRHCRALCHTHRGTPARERAGGGGQHPLLSRGDCTSPLPRGATGLGLQTGATTPGGGGAPGFQQGEAREAA